MKDKLQTLIAEQLFLMAKFEKLLNSTTEESSMLNPKTVYIKGHPTRGAEVIKMLEDLGGVNNQVFYGNASNQDVCYYINYGGNIAISEIKFLSGYTELHLPEEVSKVDPPTEEVEKLKFITVSDAIIGEIYTVVANNYRYIFIHNGFVLNDSFKPLCVMRFDERLEFLNIGGSLSAYYPIIESSKVEKDYILKAIEYNGKYFDKENMRLLDVEEWSCEKGLPFMARHHNKDKWRCVIFWEFYNIKDSNERPIVLFKSNEYCDYKCAIPYNDQTKHLIGTTDNPDKHYKFIEK